MLMLNVPAALLTVQNCDVALGALQAVQVQEHYSMPVVCKEKWKFMYLVS